MRAELPFLDLTAPGFSTRGPEVLAARDAHWCARTPSGLAVLRHREAGLLLRDRRLRQGSFAWPERQGLTGPFAEFWTRSIIAEEGPRHKALRRIARAALSDPFVEALIPDFETAAARLVDPLPPRFDMIEAVSEPFAGQAICLILGLPPEEARALSKNASALGIAMGPDGKRYEARFNRATEDLMTLAETLILRAEAGEDRQSFVARLLAAAHELDLSDRQTLKDLIVISIFGGVDTTRAQLGFATALFIEHPAQWAALRAAPELVPQAIDEVIRTWPTTTWSTRWAVEGFSFGGVDIAAGDTLHILVHSSGRDPR
ncbi:MAG: cytochrome P450, partial [Pseudomonadota bacterium]